MSKKKGVRERKRQATLEWLNAPVPQAELDARLAAAHNVLIGEVNIKPKEGKDNGTESQP